MYQAVSDFKNITIFAYSGHAYVVVDAALCAGHNVKAYVDFEKNEIDPYVLNYLGSEDSIDWLNFSSDNYVFPAMGSNSIRRKVISFFDDNNLKQLKIIHPKSVISNKAQLDLSTFVAAGVVINPLAKIGKGCIINTAAVIEHECEIGDFSHLAPGSILAGNVLIGEETFIGANSVVKQGVKIGNNVIIGAGSVVLQDITDNQTWVGNPAKRIR